MVETRRTEEAGSAPGGASHPGQARSGRRPPRDRNFGGKAPGRPGPDPLNELDTSFAGQIATAVWLGRLTEEGALEALLSYAIARHLCEGLLVIRLRAALFAEYRHWRERQDLAS